MPRHQKYEKEHKTSGTESSTHKKCTSFFCAHPDTDMCLCVCASQMVRVLVATAIREAAAGGSAGALERLLITGERRATAPPMPPQGLSLADVGFSQHIPPPLVGR